MAPELINATDEIFIYFVAIHFFYACCDIFSLNYINILHMADLSTGGGK